MSGVIAGRLVVFVVSCVCGAIWAAIVNLLAKVETTEQRADDPGEYHL